VRRPLRDQDATVALDQGADDLQRSRRGRGHGEVMPSFR
jgi:hypothetical protein